MNKRVATRTFTLVKEIILNDPTGYDQNLPQMCLIRHAETVRNLKGEITNNIFATDNPRRKSALKKLGITEAEFVQLFWVSSWPRFLARRLAQAQQLKTRSRIGAARLDYFLATGE